METAMKEHSADRRGVRRMDTFEEHRIGSACVRPGHRARLIDVSSGGALIETNHRLLPGSEIELDVEKGADRARVRGRVVRCDVVRLRPTWVCYRGAIAFDRHLLWFVDERGEVATPRVI
jgi:hypothetical protein